MMTSCRYDAIYHPFPINSQYLKIRGLTALCKCYASLFDVPVTSPNKGIKPIYLRVVYQIHFLNSEAHNHFEFK